MFKSGLAATAILFATTAILPAQQAGNDHRSDHNMHMNHVMPASEKMPTEPGQGAFAAIAEIVAMLEQDPGTDWNLVNIDALREHLIDMSNVTLGAVVTTYDIPGGARFEATGTPAVLDSLGRMVPAHANTMDGVNGWHLVGIFDGSQAALEVTGKTRDEAEIRGLGFLGVMAMGMHHQAHHLAIATGRSPH